MPTILSVDGFDIRVYPKDHEPPHVHVFRGGQQVKIAIGNEDIAPCLMGISAMPQRDVVKAFRLVEANQSKCLDAWRTYHA